MHPRNRYKNSRPDFSAYADTRPSLRPFLIAKKKPSPDGIAFTLDFSDPDALRELTCACLQHDFGLSVEIPSDHLVPIIPQKLNYIHWIEDLLSLSSNNNVPVKGLDIGTGATCIYPLLGATCNGWTFLATEILPSSVECARENVQRNKLDEKVKVKLVSSDVIICGALDEEPTEFCYDFCMCNPPFYKDNEDKHGTHSRTAHRPIPNTSNTGNQSETITEGGEVEFVKRIIADSMKLRNTFRWYSSMLGKKSSLKAVKADLKSNQVPVVLTTQFVQGKTHRWGVAWSFLPLSSSSSSSPGSSSIGLFTGKRKKPFSLALSTFSSTNDAREWLKALWNDLKVQYSMNITSEQATSFSCSAELNTWGQQRKRRRLKEKLKTFKNEDFTSSSPVVPITTLPTCDPNSDLLVHHDEVSRIVSELESLDTPCQMKFTAVISGSEEEPVSKKRKENDDTEQEKSDKVSLTLEWVSGESSDHLHQILQLIQNRLSKY